MEYEELRTRKDCSNFNDICELQMTNDMCRALCNDKIAHRDSNLVRECSAILKRIEAMNLHEKELPRSFLEFQKYCGYITLIDTLRDFLTESLSTTTVYDVQLANKAENEEYWSKIDSLTSAEASALIKKFTIQQCKFVAKKCYMTTDDKDESIRCNDCLIDSVFTCVGRPEDLCGNSSKDKSTSFYDKSKYNKLCSHLVTEAKGAYDYIIGRNVGKERLDPISVV